MKTNKQLLDEFRKKEIARLYEMAFSRKEGRRKVENLSSQIAYHLLKVFLMPNHESINHWQKELESWRRVIIDAKSSKMDKDNFGKDFLIKVIWTHYFAHKNDLINRFKSLKADGYEFDTEIDKEVFRSYVMRWIESVFGENPYNRFAY
jgi:hypothetical protein